MNNSLNFRKDTRSATQFKSDIKFHTEKEKCLVEIFARELIKSGSTIVIKNNGIDNSGDFVKNGGCNSDYLCIIDGEEGLYEVKCSPVKNKCTFKVYNLEQYVEQNSNILLFYGAGKDPCQKLPRGARWAIITPYNIKRMLQDKEPYKEKAFGFKMCIRIYSEEFDKYFKSHTITDK
jgi:hypothetical protein